MKKFLAATLIVLSTWFGTVSGTAEARLGTCTTVKVYEQVQSICRSATASGGYQRINLWCVVSGSTQQFFFPGPWVGINQWSRSECPWPMKAHTWYVNLS